MKIKEMVAVVEQNAGRSLGRLAFYDSVDGKPIGSAQVGYYPHEVIIATDQKTAYVSNYGFFDHSKKIGSADLSVSCIDILNRAEKFRLYTFDPMQACNFLQIDKAPHDLQLRPPDEKELYVNVEQGNKIIVFDLQSHEIIKKIATLQNIRKMVFSVDGKVLWLVSLDSPDSIIAMSADNGQITGQYKLVKSIQSLSYSPDKRYLVASGENAVALFDPNTLSIHKLFNDLGVGQIFYSDMTLDNRYLISPAGFDNTVIIIEIASGKVIKRIVTGFTPVAVKVFANFAYVTHPRDEHITKINLDTFETENFNTSSGTNGIALLPFSAPVTHKKLKLGVALPFSGKDAVKATDMMAGYEFWKLYVRNAGGLWVGDHAYDIDIIYLDTQSEESKVSSLTEELIKNHKVDFLLPTYGNHAYQLEKEIAAQNRVPLIPSKQSRDEWQPNDVACGQDYFITSKIFDQLFESHFKMKTSYLSASSTAIGIVLQQALLTTKNFAYDELMAVFSNGHFHTFLNKT